MANLFSNDASCIAVWNLDDNKDSKGWNTLSASNNPTFSSGRKRQGSYSASLNRSSQEYFYVKDQDLDLEFPLRSTAATVPQFTVCGWFRMTGSSDITRVVVSKYRSISPFRCFSLFVDYQRHLVLIAGENNGYGESQTDLGNGYTLSMDRWYHFGVSVDNTNLRCRLWDDYNSSITINSSNTLSTRLYIATATPLNWTIGNRHEGYKSYSFNGWIDEIVVFDRPLASVEMDDVRKGVYGAPYYWDMNVAASGVLNFSYGGVNKAYVSTITGSLMNY